MNIRKFKETVIDWDKYEERFQQFRMWEENCYISYKKKCDQDKRSYYPVSFFDVHSKRQAIMDDIEYVYAISTTTG